MCDLPGSGIEPMSPPGRRIFYYWATREALPNLTKMTFPILTTSRKHGESFFFFFSNHTILKIVTCHCFYLLCFGAMEITCMALSFIFFMNKVDSVTIALPTFSWFRWSKYLIAAFLTDSLSSWLNIQILIQITTPYYDRQYVVIH